MKVAIIGAGAAGCFAAANLAAPHGLQLVVYEKSAKPLQKVKVSGGGRCNVTHHCFDVPQLLTRYPRGSRLLKRTLHTFPPQHTIDWFAQRGVKLKAEPDGRMFPVTDDSQTIIDCLWTQMMNNHTEVLFHKGVVAISKEGNLFTITFADKTTTTAHKVIITSGGFPKLEQYRWLSGTGHTIIPPVPSLFTFNLNKHPITELMGVAVPMVSVKIAGTKVQQEGPLLITHWGLSGPAILKTSAIAARELAQKNYEFDVLVNWLHTTTDADLKEQLAELRRTIGKQLVIHKNPFELPRRLWEYLLQQCAISDTIKWGDLPATAQNKLIEHLLRDKYAVKGKTTFKEEFVTCGGIDLSEIDPNTLESKKLSGLYFAGEILDVDGVTGGFNFQHAWSSAYVAAQHILSGLQQ